MLDARRDEEEVAEAQAGRLGAGTLQPGLAVGDEMEDGVVLGRQSQSPRRGQLAVAVEALDEPQIPQHFGQGVVRLGPGRLVQHRRRGSWAGSDDRLYICDILSWTVRLQGRRTVLVATHWERGAARFTTRERHMATIAVMGASGNIGSKITEHLLAGGHTVRAIGRSAEKLAGARARGRGGPARRRRRRGVPEPGLRGRGRRVHAAAAQPRLARRPRRDGSSRDVDRRGHREERRRPRGRDQQRRGRRCRPAPGRSPGCTRRKRV